jgi:hypothetical protein
MSRGIIFPDKRLEGSQLGYIQEPPPTVQIAEARDELFRYMPAPKLAELRIISKALADPRYEEPAKNFKLTVAEAQGYVATARATKRVSEVKAALAKAQALIDNKILRNPEYDPYRITVAVGEDPLLGIPPYQGSGEWDK